MLDIKNLTFSYQRNAQPIISDLSISIQPGQIYGLLGPNGAGKSTLLYLISGLLTPKSGQVDLYGVNTRLRQPATLADIFLVPEEFELPATTLDKYVKSVAQFYPKFSYDDLRANLNTFGLTPGMRLDTLSMGQKKKAYMCVALAANTPLLLMDEPTNGLDIPGKALFRQFVASHTTDDKAIIISTHQVRDIDQLLDHVVIMDQRGLLLNESVNRITQQLAFSYTNDPAIISRAIYSIPDLRGTAVIMPNDGSLETEINLELLFLYVTTHPEIASKFFSL